MQNVYEVISGSYDEFEGVNEPNCKYVEEFETYAEALEAYKAQSTQVWSAMYKGEMLIKGYSPL